MFRDRPASGNNNSEGGGGGGGVAGRERGREGEEGRQREIAEDRQGGRQTKG